MAGSPLYKVKDYLSGEDFELLECAACGFVATYPQPSPAEIARYYPSSYYQWKSEGAANPLGPMMWFWKWARRVRNRQVMRMVKGPGVVLDVGCGRGDDLLQFKREGWEVYGTEREGRAGPPPELGGRIFQGNLMDAPWEDERFDCLTFWNSLEHLPGIPGQLEAARRLLKPGGSLFIEVPNLDSWQAKAFGRHWFHLDPPRHFCHLRPRVLERILREAGFMTERIGSYSYEYETFGWIQSAQNKLLAGQNALYRNLKARNLGAPQALLQGLAAAMGAVFLPVGIVATMRGAGVMLRYRARKPLKGSP